MCQWVFQVVGVVEISGVVGVVWVVVWFVIWQIWLGVWIIGLLGFSGNEVVFDVNFLVVGVGVVYIVCGVDNFVELLVLMVVIFLVMVVVVDLVVVVGKGFVFLFKVVKVIQKFIYDIFFVLMMFGIVLFGWMSE